MTRPRLSVAIITRDEEADLPDCLQSLELLRGLEPEVVVLDGGSTDGTLSVARRRTPHVFVRDFTDFADQKQAAVDRCSGDWVLSVDADERVTPALAAAVASALSGKDPNDGYIIPFEVEFMGRVLRHGGLGGERHLRLFRKAAGRFTGGELHEGVEVEGPVGVLSGSIRHRPYRDLDDYLAKLGRYTTLGALKRMRQGARFRPWHHLLPAWEFFRRAVLRLGALDGTPGIVWAALSSFHTWVKYLKLRQLGPGAKA